MSELGVGAEPASAKAIADLGWPSVLAGLADRCRTGRGRRLAMALPFVETAAAARETLATMAEAQALILAGAEMRFGGLEDVHDDLSRAKKGGHLDADALVAVARTAEATTRLGQHLERHAEMAKRLATECAALPDLGHVYHPILESFDADGALLDHASPDLGPLRQSLAAIKGELERRMRVLVDEPKYADWLQDRFYTQRDDRFVVPVRADSRGYVRGIVHGTSQSGQTLFIEPEEIVDLNNRLKLAECAVLDEERRILTTLTRYVAEEAGAMIAALEAAARLDLVGAKATLCLDLDCVEPEISDGGVFDLRTARHPLMVLSKKPCVPNHIRVECGTVLVISGPNAGGKTVALKTAGLCALMVRAGLAIPAARGSVVPWFTFVGTDIGDSQSLERDLSTFSAHLVGLREWLARADRRSLLLVDEISAGTDPDQGAALAQAVLESLNQRGVTTIVTTHFERLKVLGTMGAGFANASVGFDMEALAPTFTLSLGTPGSSGALMVARRLGLEASVVDRAEALLGVEAARVDRLLGILADERRRLEEERVALLLELEDAERARVDAEKARDLARERERKAQTNAHSEAIDALRRARNEIEVLRREAQRAKGRDEIKQVDRRLRGVAAEVAKREPRRKLPPGRTPVAGELVAGVPVIVTTLGGRGEVAEPPVRDKVTVLLGGIKTVVAIGDLLIDTHRQLAPADARIKEKAAEQQAARAVQPPVALAKADDQGKAGARTPDATIDVRGERVHDALALIDRFIDDTLLTTREVVFIIHGHGTGALRRAIREHLGQHRGVERFRPGEGSEGGDGVTVLWVGAGA